MIAFASNWTRPISPPQEDFYDLVLSESPPAGMRVKLTV